MNAPGQHAPCGVSLLGRRRLLQVGGLGGLGLALPQLFQAQAVQAGLGPPAGLKPIRSCVLIFFYGGPSHLDTWDMKPDAPLEVRGDFQSIATSVPGLRICEHLPQMAQVMHRVALVRSMHHAMRNHDSACTHTFTGRVPPRGLGEFLGPQRIDGRARLRGDAELRAKPVPGRRAARRLAVFYSQPVSATRPRGRFSGIGVQSVPG